MQRSSTYPPAPPLPPNRRVRKAKGPRPAAVLREGSVSLEMPSFGELEGDDLEASSARAGRWKEGLRVGAGVLLTLAAALGCVWGLLEYTRTSPRFAVRTIQVNGSAHRSSEDIAQRAGVSIGRNIFTIDLEAARANVLNDAWIEQASLRRRLPSSVTIDVVEREAYALVAIGPDLYLSTRQGELFKKPEPGDPYDLPVVTGVRAADVTKDRAQTFATIKRALDLAADYEHIGPAKNLPVQEIHLADDGGLVLSVGKDAIALHLGKGPYRQTLEQASRVLADLVNRRAQASVVFLDNDAHPERVVVRMR
ncbi:MAG TPA: FtsQ-type POTRA domain-containing protein [Polyangiaceae bacterium]|nr:FtsQ-type POTRA domain-containing protein [Polyangiaceae bacterium]